MDGDGDAEARTEGRVLDRRQKGGEALGEVVEADRERRHQAHLREAALLRRVADERAIGRCRTLAIGVDLHLHRGRQTLAETLRPQEDYR